MKFITFIKYSTLIISTLTFTNLYAESAQQIQQNVNNIIQPLMTKYHIPGMAVAVTIDGKNYFYNYGTIAENSQQAVNQNTLFEIASVSKTFAGVLATYLNETGKISFAAAASDYIPQLKGTAFDNVTLLNLATHTSSLPMANDAITNDKQLMQYYQQWQPKNPIGSQRIYSNLGVGLLGIAIAEKMNTSYASLLKEDVLEPMGLTHTYFNVPRDQLSNYAIGYTANNVPTRTQRILLPASSGLKSSSSDLVRYLQANMQEIKIPADLQHALIFSHVAYYKTPDLTQDIIWEQHPYPTSLANLLKGHDSETDAAVSVIHPPIPPQQNVLIDKTGVAEGFSSYIAFIPAKKIGVVVLANKFYPYDEKVVAGYKILTSLEKIN